MSTSKIIVVHGATGLQGGSVARHLASVGYVVRAVVRDTNAATAVALASTTGITLAHVPDLLDNASLRAAYDGADAVFGCTMVNPDEERQGKAMADAALAAGVKLFVWSSLDAIETASKGKIAAVDGFDSKARVATHLGDIGVPSVILFAGGFFENFVRTAHTLSTNDAGEINITNPFFKGDVPVAFLHVRKDLPSIVQIAIEHPADFLGREIVAAPTNLTLTYCGEHIEAVTGRKTNAIETPLPPGLPERLSRALAFYQDESFVKMKGLPLVDPKLTEYEFKPASFDDFVKEEIVPYLKLA